MDSGKTKREQRPGLLHAPGGIQINVIGLKGRCAIIANRCVIIGIRAKPFTGVNSCRPHPQCLAFYQFQYP